LVIPFPPGGAGDIVGRAVAQELSRSVGQPVVSENRAGANGVIASDFVAKAPADGYTILMTSPGPISILPHLGKLPFDPVRDFLPVTLAVINPLVIMAHPSMPVKTIRELIALARSGRTLNAGHSGNGGPSHLAIALLNAAGKISINAVPYKGESPALTEFMGGQIELAVVTLVATLPHIKSGRIKLLAATSAWRPSAMPNLPTVAEAGLPGYRSDAWLGFMVPAGTPGEVVARLNTEIVRFVKSAEFKRITHGSDPIGNTPEEFAAFIRDESTRNASVIKSAGIAAQ
jgi:tripartite-type tricarboxylate transporter receptor subunit TctC